MDSRPNEKGQNEDFEGQNIDTDIKNIPSEILKQDDCDFIKQLDIQLENLDDEEFQLPPISELPTLESILNESKDDDPGSTSDYESNFLSPNLCKTAFPSDGGDTASLHSKESSDSRNKMTDHRNLTRRDIQSKPHGSVLRHIVLKGLATQIISAHDRVGAGLPSTMAIGKVICIGTSHGLILVFEPSQALKWCLGSTQLGEQFGAVSAMAINQECSKLLAGFAKGHLCLFDLTNGKLLQNIPDAHTPHTAVLHIKWTDCPGLSLLSDSGGSVFELSLKRTMGMNSNESRCIFSGSRGEVCAIEPLLMGHFLSLPPIIDTVIVAMATISKMIVVSLRPHLKVLFSHPLTGSSSTLPLLSWQFVIIQMPDGSKVIDPVLAFARETTIFFYQLTHGSQEELTFIPLQRMNTSYILQALAWLNSRTIAVIDIQERLHVIDVKIQEELDIVDLARLGLVYSSPHFKAIATGGNVSKAMTVAGERACYHSVISFGSQVLLLGTKSFQVVTMRTWTERIDHMVKGNKIGEALLWTLDILHDKAQAVIGLTHKKQQRVQLIKAKLRDLLEIYMEKSLTELQGRPDNFNKLKNFYEIVITRCVKVAVEADFKDLLFGKLWEAFSDDPLSRGIFLECLEPYILDDQILEMSPSITQYLLSHYENKGNLQAIEACIVHLQITSLDLHQTMTLCWTHGLYDAVFYVYTKGMRDYITPLEDLLTMLKSSLDASTQLSDIQISLGNKLLVYISCCLAGRAYPHGDIEHEDLKKVKHEVFKCITSLHTNNAVEDELSYPFLRTLLRFDTREFLNVLALAFEEEEFTSELGMVQRQRVVDILLQVMVENEGFSPSQLGSLFTFIARQISKHQGAVALNRKLIDQVVNHLTICETDSHHEERQTALLELVQGGILKEYEKAYILNKAKEAQFYRVCEYIYEEIGNYEEILECYTKDKRRRHQVFSYIRSIFTSPQIKSSDIQKLKLQIIANIEVLFQIDIIELAKQLLSIESMMPLILEIAESLLSNNSLLFDYLQALFATRSSHMISQDEPTENAESDSNRDEILFPELQEKYIDLMCEFQSSQVLSYLKGAEGYRIEETLEICSQHGLDGATALLLEKKGDFKGAFEIHLKVLHERSDKLTTEIKQNNSATTINELFDLVQTQVIQVIRMCEIGSTNLDEAGRRELWFPLLDHVLALQQSFSTQNGLTQVVRGMVGRIVNNMMPYIALPSVLERIMVDPSYSDCHFGHIKHLLKDMVQRYAYEETLYSTVVKIIQEDQLQYLVQMKSQAGLPLTINSTVCSLCRGHYHPSSKAMAFCCGHSYHTECGGCDTVCVMCSGSSGKPSSITASIEKNPGDKQNEALKKMDETQIEGLRRIVTLDDSHPNLALIEKLKCSKHYKYTNKNSNDQTHLPDYESVYMSNDFSLKLAPPTLFSGLDDV